jgi:CheY-like chemotaxis protein
MDAWLVKAGWSTTCVQSTSEALRAIRGGGFRIAVIDYRLETDDDGIRLGRLLSREHGIPFLLISGYLDTSRVVEAMRAGALDVIDKPLTESRFIMLLERASATVGWPPADLTRAELHPATEHPAIASELRTMYSRWAATVLGICDAKDDPYKVVFWAHEVGISTSMIEETCRLCHVTPRDSKNLGRFLRAISLADKSSGRPPLSEFLRVLDERTLDALFECAGLTRDVSAVPLRAFLLNQHFIPTSRPCLHELAHLAANSPYFL